MTTVKTKERHYSLDAIKFVASIMLMFHHYQQFSGLSFTYINFHNGKIYMGYLVELFFLLSGFFAATLNTGEKKVTFADYMKKKMIRLYPMCMLATLVYALAAWVYRFTMQVWWKGCPLGLWNFISSMLLIHNGGAVGNIAVSANNATWYICALLICYIIHWLLTWAADRLKVNPIYFYIGMVLLGITILTYGINKPFLNGNVARGYYGYFGGILLWNIYKKVSKEWYKWCAAAVLCVCVGAALVSYSELYDSMPMILFFLVYPSGIFICLYSKWIRKIFNHKCFEKLGSWSFEIYIWHMALYLVVEAACAIIGISWQHSLTTMILFGVGVLVWSVLMHKFVEEPLTNYLMNKCKKEEENIG